MVRRLTAGGSRIRTVGSAETKVGIQLLTLIMKSLSAADSPPIELTEEDRPGETKVGDDKHWHIFHIIARRMV